MPVTVTPTYTEDPPVVNVEVKGGGGDKSSVVDLYLRYDPKKVKYLGGLKPKKNCDHKKKKGRILWLQQSCPSSGKKFQVPLAAKGKTPSDVLVVALDYMNGNAIPATCQVKARPKKPKKE